MCCQNNTLSISKNLRQQAHIKDFCALSIAFYCYSVTYKAWTTKTTIILICVFYLYLYVYMSIFYSSL